MSAGSGGQSCRHCGGELRRSAIPDLWHCRHCDTGHLEDPGEAEALLPSSRLARPQLLRRLGRHLRERGLDGHSIGSLERVWLPFWQIEGTLAGWQRYVVPVTRGSDPEEATRSSREEREVEEVVTRPLTASVPACDLRGYGILGIAGRVDRLSLRPFRPSLMERESVMAVTVSRRTAERRIRLRHETTVRPSGASSIVQHFRLMRPRRRLIYLPVWRVDLTVHGVAADAIVDGVDGRLLRARLPLRQPGHAARWWAVGAGSAWLGGLHPVLGGAAYAFWLLRRLAAEPVGGGWQGLGRWMSGELGGTGPRLEVVETGEDC